MHGLHLQAFRAAVPLQSEDSYYQNRWQEEARLRQEASVKTIYINELVMVWNRSGMGKKKTQEQTSFGLTF